MEERKEVAARQPEGVQADNAGQGQASAQDELRTMAPAVDIFEDEHGITLCAEMPGVSKDRLNVQADRNGLSIEGDVSIEMPQGMQALYADVRATRYRRSFTLSGELDTERIEAQLNNGVLTLRIPKRAEFRPRRIEVQSA
ncbi:MAG: Hsp20/alpha crystallin family protein [Burkholderiaceae bacterium]|nr:Hsp20/alpha crystallin family protein [Burkholderiaceae bacterium]